MKRYRLHDLLRLAALAWVAAACGSESSAVAGTGADAAVDASADALGDAGTDAVADTAADTMADAAADVGKDTAADTVADTVADAASDGAADASPDADAADAKIDTGADAKPDAGKPMGPFPCVDSQPILINGKETGYETCANGMIHRRNIIACPVYVPDPAKTCAVTGGQCQTDADCAGKGNNPICTNGSGGMMPGCFCQPTCSTDADCGNGQICVCGEGYSKCIASNCKNDDACPVGVCGAYVDNPGCDFPGYACQTEKDTCAMAKDCPPQQQCTITEPGLGRECSPPNCAIGRPFEVEGQWRAAAAEVRCDWQGNSAELVPAIPLAGLTAELRGQLAAWWLAAARMEHASVASFARLTLELMAVGAPADLLARTCQAGLDEVRHAETCFALHQRYSGQQLGPAQLPIDGALRTQSLAQIAAAAAREGCVWETAAALEANVAAAAAQDPVLQALLYQIAEDETAHAQLAWDIVHWAIAAGGADVKAAVRAALDEAVRGLESSDGGSEIASGHGVVSGPALANLRRHAARAVIAPARAQAGLA